MSADRARVAAWLNEIGELVPEARRGFMEDRAPEAAGFLIDATPRLLSAVGGVLERHYPRGRNIHGDEVCAAGHDVLEPWPCPEYRAVIAALSPASAVAADEGTGE